MLHHRVRIDAIDRIGPLKLAFEFALGLRFELAFALEFELPSPSPKPSSSIPPSPFAMTSSPYL